MRGYYIKEKSEKQLFKIKKYDRKNLVQRLKDALE